MQCVVAWAFHVTLNCIVYVNIITVVIHVYALTTVSAYDDVHILVNNQWYIYSWINKHNCLHKNSNIMRKTEVTHASD